MITFFTSSTQHFASKIDVSQAQYSCKKFSDGELYVKIDPEIREQEVWIVTSTQPPAENLLELFFPGMIYKKLLLFMKNLSIFLFIVYKLFLSLDLHFKSMHSWFLGSYFGHYGCTGKS
jgi:hypothetical protein